MPQKANPVRSEALVTLERFNAGLVSTMHHALLQEHERGGPGWMSEWMALPQMICTTGGSLARAGELLDGLVVNSDRMRANLDMTYGLVLAEAAMVARIALELLAATGHFPANGLVYASHELLGEGTDAGGLMLTGGAELAQSLTVASSGPVYVQGDYNVTDKKSAAVIGDAVNLLSNAAKFTSEGLIRLYVNVLAGSSQQPRVVFEVVDTGKGIAPERLEKLVEAFVGQHALCEKSKELEQARIIRSGGTDTISFSTAGTHHRSKNLDEAAAKTSRLNWVPSVGSIEL